MLFDAGQWGRIEVETVEQGQGYSVGMKNPGDRFIREYYFSFGEEGCARVRCILPEEGKGMGPDPPSSDAAEKA